MNTVIAVKSLITAGILCCATLSWPVMSQQFSLVNSNNTPMANMVVYLTPTSPSSAKKIAPESTQPPIEIHQENKQFSPYITVIQQGYQLKFVNDDDITHHIYSASGPKRFSFKLRKDSTQQDMLFDQAGHISMGCNIHDWMSGHVLVVDTPYYGVTDSNGNVTFDELPDSEYQLVVWHPQLRADNNQFSQTITTPLAEALTIQITASMDDIPTQQSLDDFDFLDGY